MIDFTALAAPFDPIRVSWRLGSTNRDKTKGMALAYIDARDVMDRLDAVCGPAGWQRRYTHANVKTVCEIGINLMANVPRVYVASEDEFKPPPEPRWVWKADGAGDSDVEAEKGALSDAFKRAAVNWGIGRYLYDLKSPWVEIEEYGKSYRILDGAYPILLKVLRDHYSQWQTARDPKTAHVVNAEQNGRKEAKEDWAAWAKSDDAKKWCLAAGNDISNMTAKADVDAWIKGNTKFINALYDHHPDRHTWVMDKMKAKREDLANKAA